jgi:hypothetical protein
MYLVSMNSFDSFHDTFIAFTQALVLCQFYNNEPDYNTMFTIVQQHFNNLDSFYYNFLWDIPILELLVYIHSKLGERKIVNKLVIIFHNSFEMCMYVSERERN